MFFWLNNKDVGLLAYDLGIRINTITEDTMIGELGELSFLLFYSDMSDITYRRIGLW